MKKSLPKGLFPFLYGAAIFLLWSVIAHFVQAEYLFPSPLSVLRKIWDLRDILFGVHLLSTAYVTWMGLLLGLTIGFVLAVIMDEFPWGKRLFYPLVVASQTIPTTAIAPLFVLWFGYGFTSRILATVLITFFPIAITLHKGLESTPTEAKELLGTYGATRLQTWMYLKFPHALPSLFTALRMAAPIAVIGAAISEWIGAQNGLGYFSRRMASQLDGAGVFAPIVLLSLLALILVKFLEFAEYLALRRRKHRRK